MSDDQQTFEELLSKNQTAFDDCKYHRAYHLLVAAFHLSVAAENIDYLQQMQPVIEIQIKWLKANLEEDTTIRHEVKKGDFVRFYEMLAEQATQEIKILALWQNV
jgi:hypothetical protein